MTTTCKISLSAFTFLMLLPLLVVGQTLENKVIESRRLQAQSQLDDEQVDSLLARQRATGVIGQQRPKSTRQANDPRRRPNLDSLLSSPQDSLLMENDSDSVIYRDSLGHTYKRKASKRAQIPKRYEQRVFGNLDRSTFSSAAGAVGRGYVLAPGDEVVVSLWGEKEKEYFLLLNKEGRVFLEGIGMVLLAGNNLDQAQQVLKQRLSKVYSGISRGTAHVDVTLGKTGPIRVFVLGEVKVPGGYVFSGHTSVLSAMYFAKGPTDIGTVRNMTLTRSGTKYNLDLYGYLLRGESLKPDVLQDGDILFSSRANALVEIDGDIGRPAVYELKKGEGVKELLEFAGGVNATAAIHKLTLQRIFEDGTSDIQDLPPPQDYLAGKAKLELRDGDRLYVDKSSELSKNFLIISGPVKYPGKYSAAGVASVSQLVAKAGGLRDDAFLGRVHVVRPKSDGSSALMAYSLDSSMADTIKLAPKDNVILYSTKDMFLPDSVQIAGAVFNPGKFEYRNGITVKDLVMQAGGFLPQHEIGKIIIFRGTSLERKVEQIVLSEKENMPASESGFRLHPDDLVHIPVDPRWYRKEVVTLDGLFLHPGKYALLYPGEKLASVVERSGGFKENAYVEGGRFYRSKDSVGRVGVDIAKAKSSPRSKANISMVGGDSIYIPERLNTVKVIGEVGFETSVLLKDGAAVQYYIEKAGGFTRRSEKDRVVVQYANGETSRDGYFNRKPDAGSVIYVPQGPEPIPVDWFSGINAILGTLGVALAVILSIQAISN